MLKFASEGLPFIIGALGVDAAVFLAFRNWVVIIPLIVTGFIFYFFRDPERNIPEGDNIIVSPADGRVIVVKETYEGKYLKLDVIQVSIFMSPLNVHVNRVPYTGTVNSVAHNSGVFFAAYKDEASIRNENIEMVIDTDKGKILVRQVAGYVARRAVCRVRPGERLQTGVRYGIIKFSSRVDLYLPKSAVVKVGVGERILAGSTTIAIWNEAL